MSIIWVYVSFDGDHIGRKIGRASLDNDPEEIRRVSQAIDAGNQIWRSWSLVNGGEVINIGGDEGRIRIGADHLGDLPDLRRQYGDRVGSTVSVGIGTKLSEADRSLMAAKLKGGDQIVLYTPEVEEILAEVQGKTEAEKIKDEYLAPMNKAEPRWAYHTTHVDRIPSIVNSGLRPGQPSPSSKTGDVLWPELWFAADDKAYPVQKPERDAQLRFPWPEKVKTHGKVGGSRDPEEFSTDQTIPSEGIEISHNGQWVPLKNYKLNKAEPALNKPSAGGGMTGPSLSQPAAPDAPTEGSEHSENEVLQNEISNAPPAPENTHAAADLHDQFGALANNQQQEDSQHPQSQEEGDNKEDLKSQVVAILKDFKQRAPELEKLQESDPEMYKALVGMVQSMIAMAQQLFGGESGQESGQNGPEEGMEKAEARPCKWRLGERRCKRMVTTEYCHDHKEHWANKIKQKGLQKTEEHANDLGLEHLHPTHRQGLLSQTTAQDMSNYITNNEKDISNHVYGSGEDYLICDQATSLLSEAMKKKGIPHHCMVGTTDDDKQSHAWIRTMDGVDLDPTQQGTRNGEIVESWGPSVKKQELEKVAPPGFSEETMHKLKAKYGTESAFKIAWSVHNKHKKNEESLQKEGLNPGKTGRHQVILPVGSQVDASASGTHDSGEVKVQDAESGKTKWRSVRAGIVMDTQGNPVSSRNPGGS